MSDWISVKDRLPDEEGPILVLIGENIIIGEAIIPLFNVVRISPSTSIEYEIHTVSHPGSEFPIVRGGVWRLRSLFKEPSHWMPIPAPLREYERYEKAYRKMSKWISVKARKPESGCMCYVTNSRGGDGGFLSIYDQHSDVFKAYDPKAYHHVCIDVTHWVPLPSPYSVLE